MANKNYLENGDKRCYHVKFLVHYIDDRENNLFEITLDNMYITGDNFSLNVKISRPSLFMDLYQKLNNDILQNNIDYIRLKEQIDGIANLENWFYNVYLKKFGQKEDFYRMAYLWIRTSLMSLNIFCNCQSSIVYTYNTGEIETMDINHAL